MTNDIFEHCQIWVSLKVKKWNMHIFTYRKSSKRERKTDEEGEAGDWGEGGGNSGGREGKRAKMSYEHNWDYLQTKLK